MKKSISIFTALLLFAVCTSQLMAAVTSQQILEKVKRAESGFKDFKADMVMSETNKKNIKSMGDGYGDILLLKKATISYKKPNRLRWDGYADGIKLKYVQNGYIRLVAGSGINSRRDTKNDPGKRQDSLDMGFLSSQLWIDNSVTVVSMDNDIAELRFDPKNDETTKRKDLVWVDTKTLKIVKKEYYGGNGVIKTKTAFSEYKNLANGLPIAVKATLYTKNNGKLGVVKYTNLKLNTGLKDSVFATK